MATLVEWRLSLSSLSIKYAELIGLAIITFIELNLILQIYLILFNEIIQKYYKACLILVFSQVHPEVSGLDQNLHFDTSLIISIISAQSKESPSGK